MDKKDYYYLGKITKTFGYKGEVIFFFDVDDINNYKKIKSVFLKFREKLIPYFIDKIKFRQNNTAIVKIQDIDDEENAQKIINSELYLPLEFLPELKGNRFYYHEIIGFTVIDEKHGNIGVIEKVLDNQYQDIFSIKKENKEILIPVADEIIKKVDRKNKVIEIEAPDGLIEIYI